MNLYPAGKFISLFPYIEPLFNYYPNYIYESAFLNFSRIQFNFSKFNETYELNFYEDVCIYTRIYKDKIIYNASISNKMLFEILKLIQ